MKIILKVLLALCMALTVTSCGENITPEISESAAPSELVTQTPTTEPKTQETATPSPSPSKKAEAFDGKIAIVTYPISWDEEAYRSAQQLVEKYGEDKIIHKTWPDSFMEHEEAMVTIFTLVSELLTDPEFKALIINPAIPGSNGGIDKLCEMRDDIFVVYCNPQENPDEVSDMANLTLMADEIMMGPAMVKQAHKAGAKTFIHYSFPRHMAQPILSARRDLMKEECEKFGIKFVDETAPDPQGDIGMSSMLFTDFPKMIEQYGKDTAFFSTNCGQQVPLIKAVVDGGAIYPQPCCPSPFHGFPAALGLDTPDISKKSDIDKVISETKRIIAEKGMTGRVSTWPVSGSMMSTNVGAEYAIKWMNGEVPKEEIDADVLKELMEGYAGVPLSLTPFEDENGAVFDNYLMFLMDYIVY